MEAVDRTVALLADHPELGPVLVRDARVRHLPIQRFPYRVIYRLGDEQLVIIAFAHTRRRPGYWRVRL